MKAKLLLMLFALIFVCPTFGQSSQIKKVAILETVDKEGKVPHGIKSLVRSGLAQAVANTPGYKAYDRVDIASIMNEHDFQRTGLVSDNDIKRLGEMVGADYILSTEVNSLDDSHAIIIAKIINIETAQLEETSSIQTATDVEAMDNAIRELADRLLGVQRGRTIEL